MECAEVKQARNYISWATLLQITVRVLGYAGTVIGAMLLPANAKEVADRCFKVERPLPGWCGLGPLRKRVELPARQQVPDDDQQQTT